MNATLYLSGSSFSNYEDFSPDSICSRIMQLFETYMHVKDHATRFPESKDIILKCADIYYLDFLKLWECETADLYSKSCKKIPPDVRRALLKLIDRPELTYENETEIIHKIMNNDKEYLNGFLCINKETFTEINRICLISNTNEWYLFHRDYLANHWQSEEYFYKELIKYFDNIYFHPNVEKSLKGLDDGGLKHFSKTIIFNLTQLNDNFKSYPIKSNLRETLNLFSSSCKVSVTLEGNISHKPAFTFSFYDSEDSEVKVCCEPHMKLRRSHDSGDSKFHYNRIHFHHGISSIQGGKILVGYIGKHL